MAMGTRAENVRRGGRRAAGRGGRFRASRPISQGRGPRSSRAPHRARPTRGNPLFVPAGSGRGENLLRRFVADHLAFLAKRPLLLALLLEARGVVILNAEGHQELRRELQLYVRFIARVIGLALRPRRFAPRELRRMALYMAGVMTGYLSYAAATGDLERDEDWIRGADLVVGGLSGAPAPRVHRAAGPAGTAGAG